MMAVVSDSIVFAFGQAFYFAAEGVGFVTRNRPLRQEMRAVRHSAWYYWTARALRRQGRLDEAFAHAKHSFAALREADRRDTFLQMGGLAIGLLDRLAAEAGIPGGSRVELSEALDVFRAMQREPGSSSPELDRLVAWLEHRVANEYRT